MRCLLGGAALIVAAAGDPHADDLKRAHTFTPRQKYQGKGDLTTQNMQLNRWLDLRSDVVFKACEDFSVGELRTLLEALHPLGSAQLKSIYASHDGRNSQYVSAEDMWMQWSGVPAEDPRVRDGHCHEAVMWYVHHLTTDAQEEVGRSTVLPRLPVADHSVPSRDESDLAGKFYDEKVSCAKCHIGGLENPFASDLGRPEPGSKDIARRCYTNYEELYGITCGPCDGIAGPYWGDDTNQYFSPIPCTAVGGPEDIPEEERVPFAIPNEFTVRIAGGSDRWGRTTNPLEPDLAPFSERQNHMYGQISGFWHTRDPPEEDMWITRHDTLYEHIAWNGTWDVNQSLYFNLTQMHAQTRKQGDANITGAMVSLNRSDVWPIGSQGPDAMCTCVPDPVGMPDVTATRKAGLDDLTYLGRAEIGVEYINKTVVVEHYANWFFHVFMSTDTEDPAYGKAPIRLASAYAGTAVYQDWIFADPEVTHPGIFTVDVPTHSAPFPMFGEFCLNPTRQVSPHPCAHIKTFDDDAGPATWPPSADDPITFASPTFV